MSRLEAENDRLNTEVAKVSEEQLKAAERGRLIFMYIYMVCTSSYIVLWLLIADAELSRESMFIFFKLVTNLSLTRSCIASTYLSLFHSLVLMM